METFKPSEPQSHDRSFDGHVRAVAAAACRVGGQPRSTQRSNQTAPAAPRRLRSPLRHLPQDNPPYRFRLLQALILRGVLAVHHKHAQGAYRSKSHLVRTSKGKRALMEVSTVSGDRLLAHYPNCMKASDFSFVRTANGRVPHVFTATDEITKTAPSEQGRTVHHR